MHELKHYSATKKRMIFPNAQQLRRHKFENTIYLFLNSNSRSTCGMQYAQKLNEKKKMRRNVSEYIPIPITII